MPKRKGSDYEVGYKKPPKSGQFKRGRSGNPRGRPKAAQLIRNLNRVNDQLDHMMLVDKTFVENGETKTLPYVVWLIKKMQADALKGDRTARRELLEWFRANLERRYDQQLEIATWMMNQGMITAAEASNITEKYEGS